mgnify:CR=1 FL=1
MRVSRFDISRLAAKGRAILRTAAIGRLLRRPDRDHSRRALGRDRRRQAVGLAALALAGGLLGLGLAAWHEPGWYAPPVIPAEQRQRVRNSLVAAEQAFTEQLLVGGPPFMYHIYQDDLNRWIAMRREIYPLIDELLPPELGDPFIVFDEGRILVAGRCRWGPLEVVASLELTAEVSDTVLLLRATGLRCGSIGVPLGLLDAELSRPTRRRPGETWPGSPGIDGDLRHGLRLGTEARWKNGGIDYRVLDVRVEPGRLSFTIQPLGRHQGHGPNHQAPAASAVRWSRQRPRSRSPANSTSQVESSAW